jgi:hypothetical protein
MSFVPNENWLQDTLRGVSPEQIDAESPENWIRWTLRQLHRESLESDQGLLSKEGTMHDAAPA